MAKKILFISALAGIIFIFIGWYLTNIRPVSQSKNLTIFVIPKGQPTRTILKRLQAEGIIKSAPATEIYLFLTKQRRIFQAGSFRLNPAMTLSEISQTLKTGTLDVWVTIPEGWRAEQIVDELKTKGLLENSSPDEPYQLFRQSEGRLFPDTYLFAKDSSAEQIIEKMTNNFDAKTSAFGLQPSALVLASLVEREAKHETDRPLIAGVLKNRLKIGMALQVDATLQYAKANSEFPARSGYAAGVAGGRIQNSELKGHNWWPTVVAGDKNINSPYNTYKFPGLPPGPIANPGIEAIEAVINPAKTDYLYYVSESNGTTHYAKTLEEHNANIVKYLR